MASVGARTESDEYRLRGTWDAGWKRELFGCHLRLLYEQVVLDGVDAAEFSRYVEAVAVRAAAVRPRVFGRVLAVACVVTDGPVRDIELSRFQLP